MTDSRTSQVSTIAENARTGEVVGTAPGAVEEPLVQESLVEEVSIDGMCGVY